MRINWLKEDAWRHKVHERLRVLEQQRKDRENEAVHFLFLAGELVMLKGKQQKPRVVRARTDRRVRAVQA